MKKFFIIFKYEFMRQVKNKAFLVTMGIFLIVSLVGGYFVGNKLSEVDLSGGMDPGIVDGEVDENYEPDLLPLIIYVSPELKDYVAQVEAYEIFDFEYVDSVEEVSKIALEKDEVGLIVRDKNDFEKIIIGTSLLDDTSIIDNTFNDLYQTDLLLESGLTIDQINAYKQSYINVETTNLGEDGIIGYGYTYIYTMFLYMTVILFGGIVSSSVITEKTSKAMELLVTSSDATSLVAGKVFAIGLSCILLLGAVLSAFIGSTVLFSKGFPILEILNSFGGVPWDVIALSLFLFITGFFSILFLSAGFSSFASKPEDANVVITPLILIVVAVFFVNISSMSNDLLNTTLFKVLSYVPVLSPFFFFSRYVLYGLMTWEIVLGVILNLLGTYLLILFAAKIYRAGTLHYGNTVSFKRIYKSLRRK